MGLATAKTKINSLQGINVCGFQALIIWGRRGQAKQWKEAGKGGELESGCGSSGAWGSVNK